MPRFVIPRDKRLAMQVDDHSISWGIAGMQKGMPPRARKLNVDGRARMNKSQLQRAVDAKKR